MASASWPMNLVRVRARARARARARVPVLCADCAVRAYDIFVHQGRQVTRAVEEGLAITLQG